MVAILSYHLRGFKQDPILAMDLKEAVDFFMKKFVRKSRKSKAEEDTNETQDLSPVRVNIG